MSKKMFFLDLDGTTLRDDKTIPEENIEAIKTVVDQGHYVAISTGRALISAKPIAEKLGMLRKGCFLITYNGALIYDLEDNTLLRDLKLPDEYAAYLFEEAEKYQLHIQAYSDTKILTRHENDDLIYYADIARMGYEIIDDLYEKTIHSTPKVLLVSRHDKAALEKFREDHMEWEKDKCISFFSAPEYLEYCSKGGTKADGIKFFEKYLGLAHEDTIAIGDEENDLSMILEAGVGCVMCNASEAMKANGNYITTRDNNQGGVAEVLYRFTDN